jgi:hypothetical protein
MTQFIPLSRTAHGDLKVLPTNICPKEHAIRSTGVVLSEIPSLSRYYPVVFIEDEEAGTIYTAAVLGFDEGENLFANDGGWQVPCRPLNLSRAPFAMGTDGEVMVDLDSSLLGEEGSPIFDRAGAPTVALTEAICALEALQSGIAPTQEFIRTLLELGLLRPYDEMGADVPALGGRLEGVYVVDMRALRALNATEVLVLHRFGYLEVIHQMAASMGHFEALRKLKGQGGQRKERWIKETAA